MAIRRQLAIFLENKPGQVAAVSRALARQKINILAVSVSDSVDHGVLRLVVSDTAKAKRVLSTISAKVVDTPVLAIDMSNDPGQLASVAQRLAAARINIEYLYGSTTDPGGKAMVVFRVADPRAAQAALT